MDVATSELPDLDHDSREANKSTSSSSDANPRSLEAGSSDDQEMKLYKLRYKYRSEDVRPGKTLKEAVAESGRFPGSPSIFEYAVDPKTTMNNIPQNAEASFFVPLAKDLQTAMGEFARVIQKSDAARVKLEEELVDLRGEVASLRKQANETTDTLDMPLLIQATKSLWIQKFGKGLPTGRDAVPANFAKVLAMQKSAYDVARKRKAAEKAKKTGAPQEPEEALRVPIKEVEKLEKLSNQTWLADRAGAAHPERNPAAFVEHLILISECAHLYETVEMRERHVDFIRVCQTLLKYAWEETEYESNGGLKLDAALAARASA